MTAKGIITRVFFLSLGAGGCSVITDTSDYQQLTGTTDSGTPQDGAAPDASADAAMSDSSFRAEFLEFDLHRQADFYVRLVRPQTGSTDRFNLLAHAVFSPLGNTESLRFEMPGVIENVGDLSVEYFADLNDDGVPTGPPDGAHDHTWSRALVDNRGFDEAGIFRVDHDTTFLALDTHQFSTFLPFRCHIDALVAPRLELGQTAEVRVLRRDATIGLARAPLVASTAMNAERVSFEIPMIIEEGEDYDVLFFVDEDGDQLFDSGERAFRNAEVATNEGLIVTYDGATEEQVDDLGI